MRRGNVWYFRYRISSAENIFSGEWNILKNVCIIIIHDLKIISRITWIISWMIENSSVWYEFDVYIYNTMDYQDAIVVVFVINLTNCANWIDRVDAKAKPVELNWWMNAAVND